MTEPRLEFAKEWHQRGLQSLKDHKPFESFIYNWLALTIAAKTYKSFKSTRNVLFYLFYVSISYVSQCFHKKVLITNHA